MALTTDAGAFGAGCAPVISRKLGLSLLGGATLRLAALGWMEGSQTVSDLLGDVAAAKGNAPGALGLYSSGVCGGLVISSCSS